MYELWKTQNEVLNGSTTVEKSRKQIEKCKEQIKELYKLSRVNLNEKEKKVKFPLAIGIKSNSGLKQLNWFSKEQWKKMKDQK